MRAGVLLLTRAIPSTWGRNRGACHTAGSPGGSSEELRQTRGQLWYRGLNVAPWVGHRMEPIWNIIAIQATVDHSPWQPMIFDPSIRHRVRKLPCTTSLANDAEPATCGAYGACRCYRTPV